MLRPFLFLVVVALALGGCGGGGAVQEAPLEEERAWDEGAVRDHLRQLADPAASEDSVRAARRAVYAARRMARSGLMPVRAPSFFLRMGGTEGSRVGPTELGPTEAHIAGYVTGRHPSAYDELVLVVADLDRPGGAAVLEAAKALAAEARFTQTPERSVLFALWAPPRTGATGLRDYLANPTWALKNIRHALLVTTDSAAVAESLQLLNARGIPAEVVAVEDQSVTGAGTRPEVAQARTLVRTLRLTDALYERLLLVTRKPATAASP